MLTGNCRPVSPSSCVEDFMLKVMVFGGGALAREWIMRVVLHDGISALIRRHPEEDTGEVSLQNQEVGLTTHQI